MAVGPFFSNGPQSQSILQESGAVFGAGYAQQWRPTC